MTNVGVQTEVKGTHQRPSPNTKEAKPTCASRSTRAGGDGGGSGRLQLSLATAVFSLAQRLGDWEARSGERVELAEGAARDALRETRREVMFGCYWCFS